MKRKKIIWIAASIILLIIIVLAISKRLGKFGSNGAIDVATEKTELRTIIETVSASGKIQPEIEVKISPDVSGEVVELYIKEGDKVKKGDILAKINPDIYVSNLDRMIATLNSQKAAEANANARLSQAKAQLINAETVYNRNKILFEKNAISQSEYDAVKANYEVAREEVKAAEQSCKASEFNVKSYQASVKEASDNLRKTTIYAPMDGTISKLSIEKGERVVGTSQFAGTEIMRIANLKEMEVSVSVNENDIVRVSLGDTATVEVDAYSNRKFKGIVTEIANSANITGTNVDQVTNFDVKIRIVRESYLDLVPKDRPELSPFRPGMSASVEIMTDKKFNVLSVPIQAVTAREDTSDNKDFSEYNQETENETENSSSQELITYVFVYMEGKAVIRQVITGIEDDMYIHIIEGLKEGEEVIVAPYTAVSRDLKNHDKVTKKDKKELYKAEFR